jgi:sensor histidine kinase regulating citrate/malate metabolism
LNCILGNLFDNVLNALEKVERKIVYFQMVYEKGVINLCVRNSFDGAIKVNADNQLLSLKKDKKEFHGLGIKSVIEIVEKYDGEFEYEYEKMFFLYTLLCMKSKNK